MKKEKIGYWWNFGDEFKVYTESKTLFKKLYRLGERSAKYYFKNKLIGLDFVIPKRNFKKALKLLNGTE